MDYSNFKLFLVLVMFFGIIVFMIIKYQRHFANEHVNNMDGKYYSRFGKLLEDISDEQIEEFDITNAKTIKYKRSLFVYTLVNFNQSYFLGKFSVYRRLCGYMYIVVGLLVIPAMIFLGKEISGMVIFACVVWLIASSISILYSEFTISNFKKRERLLIQREGLKLAYADIAHLHDFAIFQFKKHPVFKELRLKNDTLLFTIFALVVYKDGISIRLDDRDRPYISNEDIKSISYDYESDIITVEKRDGNKYSREKVFYGFERKEEIKKYFNLLLKKYNVQDNVVVNALEKLVIEECKEVEL